MSELTTLTCPGCNGPIASAGTCPYCGAEVRSIDQPSVGSAVGPPWLEEVRAHLAQGRKIQAIKEVRTQTGMGLKEAKDFVEGGMDSPEKVAALPRLSGGGAAKSSDASCFPAEALVATPLGLRTIASLCPGDEVLSYSAAQGLTRERVTRLLCHGAASLWVTELGTGAELVSTGNHRMLTARGWVRVDSLRRGDRLSLDGGFVSVLRDPRSSGRRAPVFNLYTTGPHNFVVDGCVAHNFTTMPLLRTLMHRVFVDPFFGAGRGHKASLDLLEGIDAARQ